MYKSSIEEAKKIVKEKVEKKEAKKTQEQLFEKKKVIRKKK
jgi:hypothetical protein